MRVSYAKAALLLGVAGVRAQGMSDYMELSDHSLMKV